MKPMKDKIFIDTNILLYLLSNDKVKKTISKEILGSNYNISTQVLNEFSNISIKKFKLLIENIKEIIDKISEETTIFIFSKNTIIDALRLKEKYKFQYYDSLILATALENGCTILYCEDMQHNQIIENQLKIINPFLSCQDNQE